LRTNNALTKYAGAYSKMKAFEAIANSFKKDALAVLNKAPKGMAVVNGIEFHKTKRVTTELSEPVKKKIAKIRERAIADGAAKVRVTKTIAAHIPKSTVKAILSKSCEAYKKHFKQAA